MSPLRLADPSQIPSDQEPRLDWALSERAPLPWPASLSTLPTARGSLTDVVMPKMNGRELAERVSAMRSSIKVLFMSGYTDDVILQHGVLDSRVSFIEKPLTPDRLLQKVRDVLDT